MKYLIFSFLFLTNFIQSLEIKLEAQQNEKMKFLIGVIGQVTQPSHKSYGGQDNDLIAFAKNIKNDLEFTGQFKVTVEEFEKLKTKKEIASLANQDFLFALFITKSGNNITWRLYDTYQVAMIKGKKVSSKDISLNALAHKVSDELLPDLTGREGCFYSAIAACKKVGKKHTHLHVFHPTEFISGLNKSKPIVTEPTIILLSKWHPNKPKLFFSKHSKFNVKLASINSKKQKSIVANFDGINMPPAFSAGGRIVIPVTVEGKGRLFEYTFDKEKQKGKFKPLTKSNIHAVSPSFIDEDRIIFCAIDDACRPRIAIYNKGNVEYLNGLAGVSPTYCLKNKLIAFCKKEDDYFQVFTYDMESKLTNQLTKCKSDKDGCSWSPCGNYIIFSAENKNKSRIGCVNIWTNEMQYLTPENENWTSPSWSGIYNEIPFDN